MNARVFVSSGWPREHRTCRTTGDHRGTAPTACGTTRSTVRRIVMTVGDVASMHGRELGAAAFYDTAVVYVARRSQGHAAPDRLRRVESPTSREIPIDVSEMAERRGAGPAGCVACAQIGDERVPVIEPPVVADATRNGIGPWESLRARRIVERWTAHVAAARERRPYVGRVVSSEDAASRLGVTSWEMI